MVDITTIVSTAVALTGLAGTVFYYAVIHPLTSAITRLDVTIGNLQHDVRAEEEKRQSIDVRLGKAESSTASAHHRIDTLEGRFNDLMNTK